MTMTTTAAAFPVVIGSTSGPTTAVGLRVMKQGLGGRDVKIASLLVSVEEWKFDLDIISLTESQSGRGGF